MSIGLVITTFDSESYFDQLYETIPFDRVDHLVVVNGGQPYSKSYDKCHWIQHDKVKYASVARNDGLKYLISKNCEYYFVFEDDILVKSPDIFDKYIEASKASGIQYFGFKSNAWGSGPIGARTPRLKIRPAPDAALIGLYKNTCNEITFRTKLALREAGLFDERFRYSFDIEMLYRLSLKNLIPAFWYFPDREDSDELVENNPNAISRMNPNGERDTKLGPDFALFNHIHGVNINQVPDSNRDEIIEQLQFIKNKYGKA